MRMQAQNKQTKNLNTKESNSHLGGAAGRVHQILAGHLYRLIGSGKLDGIDQSLMTWLAVGVWDAYQIGGLKKNKERHKECIEFLFIYIYLILLYLFIYYYILLLINIIF